MHRNAFHAVVRRDTSGEGREAHDVHRVKCNLTEIDELSPNDRHSNRNVAENAEMDVISA